MAMPVVTVASGGLPVTDASAIGGGLAVEEAINGFGTAITFVPSGGLPVNWSVGDVPAGFVYLLGADGAYLTGADGAYLYGVAP